MREKVLEEEKYENKEENVVGEKSPVAGASGLSYKEELAVEEDTTPDSVQFPSKFDFTRDEEFPSFEEARRWAGWRGCGIFRPKRKYYSSHCAYGCR